MQGVQYGFLLWDAQCKCETKTNAQPETTYREASNFFAGGESPRDGSSPSAFLLMPLALAGDGDRDALGWRVLGGVERVGVGTDTSGVPERLLLSLSSFLRRAASVFVEITASA